MSLFIRSASAVFFFAVAVINSSQGNVITVTGGGPGQGLVITPGYVVAAVDVFGQQTNTNVVQGQTFTTSNPHVSIVQSTGGQANPGGGSAIGSFDASVNPNDVALTNIDRSINYGAQTITLSGLNPGGTYFLQILSTDSGANPRIEDFTINGVLTDTLTVATGQTYNVNDFATANSLGVITIAMTPNALSGDPYPVLAGIVVTGPEPSSLVLCGLGVAGLIIGIRRRRRV